MTNTRQQRARNPTNTLDLNSVFDERTFSDGDRLERTSVTTLATLSLPTGALEIVETNFVASEVISTASSLHVPRGNYDVEVARWRASVAAVRVEFSGEPVTQWVHFRTVSPHADLLIDVSLLSAFEQTAHTDEGEARRDLLSGGGGAFKVGPTHQVVFLPELPHDDTRVRKTECYVGMTASGTCAAMAMDFGTMYTRLMPTVKIAFEDLKRGNVDVGFPIRLVSATPRKITVAIDQYRGKVWYLENVSGERIPYGNMFHRDRKELTFSLEVATELGEVVLCVDFPAVFEPMTVID